MSEFTDAFLGMNPTKQLVIDDYKELNNGELTQKTNRRKIKT